VGTRRYADDVVAGELAAGIGQVVILGAGLDTRAYRLVAPAGGTRVRAGPARANTDYKLRRLQVIFGGTPERVRVFPVDFEVDDLAETLAREE
jgi:methyltransferase (TIGR00027 family)